MGKTNVKYSIIIPYRNRKSHLDVLLPRLIEFFKNKENYEIIIAEQYNNEPFQKSRLFNLSTLFSKGEILIFHDVDYIPHNNVSYETSAGVPLFPLRRAFFKDEKGDNLPYHLIPDGYKHFNIDVKDCSGGIVVLDRSLFSQVNGFNPIYQGWGKEDDDFRDKLVSLGYKWKRNTVGDFDVLPHPHNFPGAGDTQFQINEKTYIDTLKGKPQIGLRETHGELIKHEQILHNIFHLYFDKMDYTLNK
jgi:hypothetical protein